MEFGQIFNNELLSFITAAFLLLYGITLARMDIPDGFRNLFNNNIFRVLFLSLLIAFGFKKSPHVAIIIALVFVLTLNILNEKEIEENFEMYENFINLN